MPQDPARPTIQTSRYRKLITAAAELCALPDWDGLSGAVWLEGLVLHESAGGNPRAMRYEPHQDREGRRDQASDGDTPGQDDGLLEDDRSYGLFQVMGSNIRRLVGVPPGTPMSFGWALLPIASLSLGLRMLLAELAATDQNVPRALARYNGGPTGEALRPGPNGLEFRVQRYVDKVRAAALKVNADVRGVLED